MALYTGDACIHFCLLCLALQPDNWLGCFTMNDALITHGEVEHCWLVGPFPTHLPTRDFLFYFAYHFANQVHAIVDSNADLIAINNQYPFVAVNQVSSYTKAALLFADKSTEVTMKNQFMLTFKASDWPLAESLGLIPLPTNNVLANIELLQPFTLEDKSERIAIQDLFGKKLIKNNTVNKGAADKSIDTMRASATDSSTKKARIKKIAVMGPESSGKSTLVRQLAQAFEWPVVHEYAREWLSFKGNVGRYEDICLVAKVQLAIEQTVMGQTDRVVLFDTGLTSVQVWSEMLFDQVPTWLIKQVTQHRYDRVLLLMPDLPWSFDPQRCHPSIQARESFFYRCKSLLAKANIDYQVIAGADRLEQAKKVLTCKLGLINN